MRLIFAAVFLFLAGCMLSPPPDPGAAEKFLMQAERQAASGDFTGAAGSVSTAVAHDPENGELYLCQGALCERTGDLAAARRAYRAGLRRLSEADPKTRELTWRLALLHALKLEDPAQAHRLLRSLPENSAEREDLLGILALLEGDPRRGEAHLQQALQRAADENVGGTVLYHLSLARQRAGDEEGALGSLYRAAGRTRHYGLMGDLERLWALLSADPPGSAAPVTLK